MKHIVIDIQSAQGHSRSRGIGKYALALFKNLAPLLLGKYKVTLLLSGNFGSEEVISVRKDLESIDKAINIRTWSGLPGSHQHIEDDRAALNRNKINEIIYKNYLGSLEPDLIIFGSLLEGFTDNVTIALPEHLHFTSVFYDAIPLIYPNQYLESNDIYRDWYLDRIKLVKQSNFLMAISESSKSEAEKYFDYPADNIVNIKGASFIENSEDIPRRKIKATLKKFNITKPYILYMGATDSRKNHLRLFKAYSRLPDHIKQGFQLVIGGGIPDHNLKKFTQMCELEGLDVPDHVVFTNSLTDEQLKIIYLTAHLFIMPSLHEGFGLPVLEAMTFDVPVIASSTTSIPEIVENPEALFDPTDVDSIRFNLERALTDVAYRQLLVENGRIQRQKFSWEETAQLASNAIDDFFRNIVSLADSYNSDKRTHSIDTLSMIPHSYLTYLSNHDLFHLSRSLYENQLKQKATFYVDVTEFHIIDSKTGIQRVVRNVLWQLSDKLSEQYNVIPIYRLISAHKDYEEEEHQSFRVSSRVADLIGIPIHNFIPDQVVNFTGQDIILNLDLTVHTSLDSLSIYNHARALGAKLYYVVYDLLPLQFTSFFPAGVSKLFGIWFAQMVSHADGILCISRTVADELAAWIEEQGFSTPNPVNIGWFHLGVDFKSAHSTGIPDDGYAILDLMRQRPSFLMVGTMEPRKGHLQVLLAFEKLWAAGHDINLIIVGKRGWNNDLTIELVETHNELGKRLFWINRASDEYLDKLFANSNALIAASYGEGFGLPIIEASQYGIPIIARDIPVFREVAGSSTRFFHADLPEELSDFLARWLQDMQDRVAENDIHGITWSEATDQIISNIFDDSWYIKIPFLKGSPNRSLRFSDNGLTLSGVIKDNYIHSAAKEGYLTYGPYWTLEPGTYRVSLIVSVKRPSEGYADIACNSGTTILGKIFFKALPSSKSEFSTLYMDFSLIEQIEDFELRVYTDEQAIIILDEFKLRYLDH